MAPNLGPFCFNRFIVLGQKFIHLGRGKLEMQIMMNNNNEYDFDRQAIGHRIAKIWKRSCKRTWKNAILSDPVTLLISSGVTVVGKTTPSGKFNEEVPSKELDLVGLEAIWSEERLDFFGIGERMMELASAAGGGCDGAVSVGVSDCGGFAWTLGSVGGTGTSAAVATG